MEILLLSLKPDLNERLNCLLKDFLIDTQLRFYGTSHRDVINILDFLLIKKKNHIDLLIVDDIVDEKFIDFDGYLVEGKKNMCKTIIEFIQLNPIETYSDSNFYLRNLPIIKICKSDSDITIIERSHMFFDFCLESQLENYFPHSVNQAIAYTRDLITEDLKILGLMTDNQFQLIKTNFALYHYDRDLKILSKAFVERQKKSNFYWFEYPIDEVEDAINNYMDILKKSRTYNKREENKIHYFFKNNPYFILRDKYSEYFYEPKLSYPNSKFSIKPDFILKPTENVLFNPTEIFEIKLPNEEIVKKKRFHQNFYSSFWEHLAQIKDYQDYFKMVEVESEILSKLGYLPEVLKFTLLISRSEHKERNNEILNKLTLQFNFQDINILTYDELLEYQMRYYEREKRIKNLTKYSC